MSLLSPQNVIITARNNVRFLQNVLFQNNHILYGICSKTKELQTRAEIFKLKLFLKPMQKLCEYKIKIKYIQNPVEM
jgi:hypothetical protein